jgi:glutathione synthase/RimK-type ligase-like ATP-grasp enzyme
LDVVIATCAQLPQLDPDERFLVRALEALGASVTPIVWNDVAPNWTAAELCVVRSTWDYHRNMDSFLRWIATSRNKTILLNPPDVLIWNSHKFYLRDLERAGIEIVPTFWAKRGEAIDLGGLLSWLGWPEAVIKPAFGASADGIFHVVSRALEELTHAQAHLNSLLDQQDVLLQPFLTSVATHHERALVFIDGNFSHAVTKFPFMHANADLAQRAHLPPGAAGETPVRATEEEICLATRALDVAPQGHVFARVDIIRNGTNPCVLEVELIEPTLYFYAEPSAAQTLARAIVERC